MKTIIYFLAITLIISCNNQQQEEKSKTEPPKENRETCYRYVNNKDTVDLKTIFTDSAITGTLIYDFYEKDKNNGTIQGYMKGDLLVADYTFMSEGSTSVRQVVFKKINNSFVEGYGEAVDDKGSMIFKNTDSLNFNNSVLLTQIECER